VDYSDAGKLPYIGMGNDDRPVVIHLQKYGVRIFDTADSSGRGYYKNDNNMNKFEKELADYMDAREAKIDKDYQKMFVSEGFRSMTEVKDASFEAGMTYYKKHWYGTLVRPMKDDYVNLANAVVPVALAVWDGSEAGRDGQKLLSTWVPVKLSDMKGSTALADAISAPAKGNAAKGKELAIANCAACHNFDYQSMAMPYMAPNLSTLGGQATPAYIKESMVDPSAVVVPGYNRNAHPNFAWYNVVDGKRVSTMPDFTWLQPQELEDLVAYFATLK
jgi:complex iron-sulfur molybdoenzyme family reductase subunit gamma